MATAAPSVSVDRLCARAIVIPRVAAVIVAYLTLGPMLGSVSEIVAPRPRVPVPESDVHRPSRGQ
jgi:hypothetical protein